MSNDIAPPSSYVAWGPFVRHNFKVPPVTRLDLIVSSTIFGLAILLGSCAAFIGYRQTRASRQPWRCPYVWMIWLELAASVALAMICLLFLLWVIRPSFYFYTVICWVVQIQMLPQIIINRICLIMQDRKKGKRLIIGSAIFITLINISVFFVWIPARLQISEEFIRINDVWDRIEKILYLLFDVYLNWYFIRVVKAELVKNGLTKYNRLVRFNKRMIVVSLLFDVLIIAAMSIPNGMVYPIFHPLAYIAKLNIEMSMAHLIRMIALDERNSNPNVSLFVASALAPDETRPITNLFSEVRMPKRALILSLFSSDPYKFVRQDAQSIEPGNISTRTTTLTDLEFKSLEHNSSTRSGCDNDDRAAHEAGLKGPVLRENIDEEMGISQQGHDVRAPYHLASHSRAKGAE